MNFYAAQAQARKKTKWWVLLYVIVLLVISGLSILVVWALVVVLGAGHWVEVPRFNAHRDTWSNLMVLASHPVVWAVTGVVVGGALLSSWLKSRTLAKGGAPLAMMLGGVPINPSTRVPNERRALNVVAEMAIASGMPVPEVYVLPKESAINAFAAGQTPADAVIGLTQGALDGLNRAQLQGVVGHEFSHILNGDMRLNLRIIMLLHGIEFMGQLGRWLSQAGRGGVRARSSSGQAKGNALFVLAGLALRLIGWFGVQFGKMIQAAISRQREVLADASAVQFTRDAHAVADALKVVGYGHPGAVLTHTDVSAVSHLFFGQAFTTHFNFLFATHPPLATRIRALDPQWNGQYIKPLTALSALTALTALTPSSPPAQTVQTNNGALGWTAPLEHLALAVPMGLEQAAEHNQDWASDAPSPHWAELVAYTQEPLDAVGLVMACLLSELSVKSMQTLDWPVLFSQSNLPGLVKAQQAHLMDTVTKMQRVSRPARMVLIELAMPALKRLSPQQYQHLKPALQWIMALDGQSNLFELTLYQLVAHYLDVFFGQTLPLKVKYHTPQAVQIELQWLLSALAFYGQHSTQVQQDAFAKGMAMLGLTALQPLNDMVYKAEEFARLTVKLTHASLPLKDRIMQALITCAQHDGVINSTERELILAIAATLDAPIARLAVVVWDETSQSI
ncbi:M48 family metallopeptidase [Thiomicrorhabdus aquaedulcis]|uniref:M48 family metallopeptidase n=1 Tax=Thiomicrorhabdus aquaedulcis TaxID=2211106 RepID=UPI000FDBD0FE|nr:M48 family metallopeptidase [Thiomicrorhabdus aquaedulcis]